MTRPLRRPGARWRLLAHTATGTKSYSKSHHVQSDKVKVHDSEHSDTTVLPRTVFDELVVDRWLHIEQMDTGSWWMNIAGVVMWVHVDRDGHPTDVTVYAPGEYAHPVDGVTYRGPWPGGDVR
jgi:hypothetical protein